MMKKRYYLLLGVIFIFMVFVTVSHMKNGEINSIINYVQNNHIDLQNYSEKIRQNTISKTEYYDNWEVTYWPSTGIVEFMSKDNPHLQSSYKGFYYSRDDKPLGFQGNNMEFTEHDPGWIWVEDREHSDNWEYTEKIMDNWYWFDMHF